MTFFPPHRARDFLMCESVDEHQRHVIRLQLSKNAIIESFLTRAALTFPTQAVSMRYSYTICYVEQKILCHQNNFVIELYIGTFSLS